VVFGCDIDLPEQAEFRGALPADCQPPVGALSSAVVQNSCFAFKAALIHRHLIQLRVHQYGPMRAKNWKKPEAPRTNNHVKDLPTELISGAK
jgi:hypothetical protein